MGVGGGAPCLAKAWEDTLLAFSHLAAFEGITRMPQGLMAPGFSDFSLPSPFRQSPQNTETDGRTDRLGGSPWALLPVSPGRAGCSSLCPSKRMVSEPRSAQLSSGAGHGAPPWRSPSHCLICKQEPRASRRQGSRCRRGAHRLACHQRRGPRLPTLFHARCRVLAPQASRPAQPSPAPRPFGPLRPGPAHPGSGRRGPRSRARAPPPSRRGLQGHPPGAAPPRAPADPRRPYLPSQVSRLRSALPPPPSALTWVAGKRLAGARHGAPLGTHFLPPPSAAAHLAEAPPSSGPARRVRP